MRLPLKIFAAALLLTAAAPAARAQETPPPDPARQCGIFEQIYTPRKPAFGVPSVWDAQYGGRDAIVQVAGAVPLEGGSVMIAGRRLDLKSRAPTQVFLAEINNRGRALLEKSFPAKSGEAPVQVIESGGDFLVLSAVKGGKNGGETQTRLAWYKRDGAFLRDKSFGASGYNYEALSVTDTGSGTLVAIRAVSRRNPEGDRYAVILRLAGDGRLVWKRAYRPGTANEIRRIVPTSDKNYLAAGSLKLEDGRMAGWIVKLTPNGEIFWQRAYPRGRAATLADAVSWPVPGEEPGAFALIGTVAPADGSPASAWVMAVGGTGTPLWQRYFHRADTPLAGAFLSRSADGRFTAAVNMDGVNGAAESFPDHIRLFTLSAEGVLTGDEPYLDGLAARAVSLGAGADGARIVAATISAESQPETQEAAAAAIVGKDKLLAVKKDAAAKAPEGIVTAEKQKPGPVEKGWLFAAVPLPPYDDPCRPKPPAPDGLLP
jgi:hypothetical protein